MTIPLKLYCCVDKQLHHDQRQIAWDEWGPSLVGVGAGHPSPSVILPFGASFSRHGSSPLLGNPIRSSLCCKGTRSFGFPVVSPTLDDANSFWLLACLIVQTFVCLSNLWLFPSSLLLVVRPPCLLWLMRKGFSSSWSLWKLLGLQFINLDILQMFHLTCSLTSGIRMALNMLMTPRSRIVVLPFPRLRSRIGKNNDLM